MRAIQEVKGGTRGTKGLTGIGIRVKARVKGATYKQERLHFRGTI